jgi:hypothetical protein
MITYSADDYAPRRDLSESAFRRYEPFIAAAATRDYYEVNTITELTRPVKPQTFCTRFRDALLAFRRYHYHSHIIPVGFDVRCLKVAVLKNGNVLVANSSPLLSAGPGELVLSPEQLKEIS